MATDRDGLGERPLAAYEKGKASDPSSVKLTAPFLPSSSMSDQTPAARAAARFAVRGNAIVTGGAGDIASVACRALLERENNNPQQLRLFDTLLDTDMTSIRRWPIGADHLGSQPGHHG